MKDLKFGNEFIAYASAFVAFVLPKLGGIKEIILFGSAARGEADKQSDIDLFFDVERKEDAEKTEEILKKEANRFDKSKIAELWFLKGIKNDIKAKVGILDEWELKRSIISEGIVLYGKYKVMPKKLRQLTLFVFEPIKDISKRNRITRLLFGRTEKKYFSEGLIKKSNGKKISPRSFIIPPEYTPEISKLFSTEKISYKIFELWSDQF